MPEPTRVEDSILQDIKEMLGSEWDDKTFDLEIKTHINTVFFNLKQIGVGPSAGFRINDENNKWQEFAGPDPNVIGAVKDYIWVRVKLAFDPGNNGFLINNLKEQAQKLEWTLQVEFDPPVPQPLGSSE